MDNVTSILDRVNPNLTNKPSETISQSLQRKTLIALVWQVLLSRRLVSAPVGSIEYRTFESDMADMSEAQLNRGKEAAKDFTGFFTFPAFRELCRANPEDLGLRTAKHAYIEACNMPTPWSHANWSSPAVHHAAKETGQFELHSGTERDIFPLFKANYEKMCARVMSGESLDLPVTKLLPETVPNPTPPEEAKKHLSRLKGML
jgi:hypothetical protein